MSNIHQEVDFKASPDQIFEALTNETKFAAMSEGAPSAIDPRAGGAFTLFGGYVTGQNVELVPGRRIVQVWRAGSWPEGTYSLAKFQLEANGAGTKIVFDHDGFPADHKDQLASGWEEHYWAPLRKHVG